MQALGFVDYVANLDGENREMIMSSKVKYFIPWRAVWNEKSLSTPCRLVFDASQGTRGGCSLNSLLAKGANGMNKLVEILIRWTVRKYAFHTDITKMYQASTGYIVRMSLKDMHKRYWKITDSQVALHWISSTKSVLNMWVRNRVLEINRLSDRSNWRYVCSENNIADLGTRRGATVSDVSPNSYWIQGFP